MKNMKIVNTIILVAPVILIAIFISMVRQQYVLKAEVKAKFDIEVLKVEYSIDKGLEISPCVFIEVQRVFKEAGIEVAQIEDTTDLPDIYPYPSLSLYEEVYYETMAKSRRYRGSQHILLAKLGTPIVTFGWTFYRNELGDTFTVEQLDQVGSIVFIENLDYWTEGRKGINYLDSSVSFEELVVKVIVHELGHQLGSRDSDNLGSAMHQGMELSTVQGLDGKGLRFLKKDIEGFKFDKRLGINRVKWL